MAEYIEREAAVHLLMNRGRYLTKDLVMDASYEVSKIPAADVAPVVHGRWVKGVIEREPVIKNGRVYRNDTQTFQCSECKETFAGITYGFNYCPNCGAHMKDGEP